MKFINYGKYGVFGFMLKSLKVTFCKVKFKVIKSSMSTMNPLISGKTKFSSTLAINASIRLCCMLLKNYRTNDIKVKNGEKILTFHDMTIFAVYGLSTV